MRSAHRVVVRKAPGLRLAAILPGIFAVAISWGIVDMVIHLDPRRDFSGVSGPVGTTIAWIVTLALWFLTTMATLVMAGMRQVFTPEGVSVRTLFRSHHLPLTDVKEIQVTSMRVHTASVAGVIPLGALRVLPDPQRSRVRAVLNSAMGHSDAAMQVLDGWVRARPEIARHDDARALFASRGALVGHSG